MRTLGGMCVAMLLLTQGAMAQQAASPARLAPESPLSAQIRNPQDAAIVQRADAQRSALENEVKDYLVPLRAWDGKSRPPIGVSLLANGTGPVDMVWDTSTQTMAAQWRLVQKTDSGQKLYYTTTVNESGALNFSISSRF
ncbi:hypothetical protein RQP54_07905 [Curvibacter sp. APW13]|uniref:hypothetical protein n=1 Tax=Curvibacter sp. APW13 TaxID=3077236 RepID=UPI0028E06DEB|nr:hypothetical protein [Curvibacter sp. APW13]MDT8990790.1 hypothetical protein [Curvibacter sp. APW13]